MDASQNDELGFKLPEIRFSDDEDDENEDPTFDGNTIKIFSRPTLGTEESGDFDLSFLDDTHDDQDWFVESSNGIQFPEPEPDISYAVSTKATFTASTSTSTDVLNHDYSADAAPTTVQKYSSTGTSTSWTSVTTNCKSLKSDELEAVASKDWPTLKLGDVADLELSRALDQLRLPQAALDKPAIDSMHSEPDIERNEELLRQLSQHSLRFAAQPRPRRISSSGTTARTTNSTSSMSGSGGLGDAMADRLLQAMAEVTKRATVRVDLRGSQAVGLQMSDLLRFGPGENGVGDPGDMASVDAGSSEEEEEEEEEVDGARRGGLWLDSYRRARRTEGAPARAAERKPEAEAARSQKLQPSNVTAASAEKSVGTAAVARQSTSASVTEAPPLNVSMSAPDDLDKKLAAMRQREFELSKRRALHQILRDAAPHLTVKGLEPIFHEDVSFSPAPQGLDPAARGSENLLLLEASLSPSYQFLASDGNPVEAIDTGRDLSYPCLLAWLLSLARERPRPDAPLHILGLRQAAASWDAGGSPQTLRLEAAAHANRLVPLHQFLAGHSLWDVCQPWLAEAVGDNGDCAVSKKPLATLLRVNQSEPGQALSRGQPAMFWCPLGAAPGGVSAEHWPPCSLPMEVSVLELERDLAAEPGVVLRLLRAVTAARCDVVGARLAWTAAANPVAEGETGKLTETASLSLAVRGSGAVAAMRAMSAAAFQGHREGWSVSRYAESVQRDLARHFGGRLSPKTTSSQARALATASPAIAPRLLTTPPLEDLALLASPLVIEIGWVLHLAAESGFALIGCRRVQLQAEQLSSQLGMPASQAACYAEGAGCALLLRRENAVRHAAAFIEATVRELRERRQLDVPPSLLFFAMPYLPGALQAIHCTRIESLPKLRADAHTVEDPSHPDQEQLSVLLVSGPDFQATAAQLLDQLADFELLGLKCLPQLPQLHAHFVSEQLCSQDSGAAWRGAKPLMEQPLLTFAVRGVGLQDRLRQVLPHYPANRDYQVLHAGTWHQAYCLARNLFSDSELFESPDRRPCLIACPPESRQRQQTVLAQLRHPGPDRVETQTLLLLRGPALEFPGDALTAPASTVGDDLWLLRGVARAARLVAKDKFALDWLGLVAAATGDGEQGQEPAETRQIFCAMRLRRENAVAALAARRAALVEALPPRVAPVAPTDWRELTRLEEGLQIEVVTAALTEVPSPSRDGQRYPTFAVNLAPAAASAAGDCTALLWGWGSVPDTAAPGPASSSLSTRPGAASACERLPLLARLCDLLHRRGMKLLGCRTVNLAGLAEGRCADIGRELRLRSLRTEGGPAEARFQPGIYFVMVLEGNLVSLGLRGYLADPSPPQDPSGLLAHLGPSIFQSEGATAGAVRVANHLGVPLLPSNHIVYPGNE